MQFTRYAGAQSQLGRIKRNCPTSGMDTRVNLSPECCAFGFIIFCPNNGIRTLAPKTKSSKLCRQKMHKRKLVAVASYGGSDSAGYRIIPGPRLVLFRKPLFRFHLFSREICGGCFFPAVYLCRNAATRAAVLVFVKR